MAAPDPCQSSAAAAFLTRLARVLHECGTPAHRLEQAMNEVAAAIGVEARFFATPTAIFTSLDDREGASIRLERLPPGQIDLEQLTRADRVARDVARGALDLEAASRAIKGLRKVSARYGRWTTLAAFAVASAGVACFFGGTRVDLAVSAVVGALIGALAMTSGRFSAAGGSFEAIAALTASLLGAAAASTLGASSFVVTLAGLIVLIPGLTLTLAIAELASNHLASGTARLSGALTVFLLIGFGVALGSRLGGLLPAFREPSLELLPAWIQPPAVIAVSVALVVLFKAHPRDAAWIIGAGSLGFYGARAGSALLGPELGTFVGGLLVGLAANAQARLLDRPSAVAAVPGIMLLVPGSLGFRSMTALMADDVISGVETAFTTVLVAAALVTGLLASSLILPSRKAL